MALKDILVHLAHAGQSDKCLDLAVDLALRHGARLTGLTVASMVNTPTFVPGELVRREIESIRRGASAIKAEFEARVRSAGITSEFRLVDNTEAREDVADIVRTNAYYTDLLVLGQIDQEAADGSVPLDLSDRMVMEAGRPVVVVPYAWRYHAIGDHVLIAWNARREACRAVNDALPILEQAKSVRVLALKGRGKLKGHGDLPGADIAAHLARHGIQVEAEFGTAEDIDVGDMLLSTVASEGADLLVMGGYGRSRMREYVMGGATQHMLRHMTVPVLMSH
jgi:nucleotide-binding universal stress UspA family protein